MVLKAKLFSRIFNMLFEKRTRQFVLNPVISIVIMSMVLLSAVVALQIVPPFG